MLKSREHMLAHLDELGIEQRTVLHPPVFTVEQAQEHTSHLAGGHCKNLFLRNRKGTRHYLVVAEHRAPVSLARGKATVSSIISPPASSQRLLSLSRSAPKTTLTTPTPPVGAKSTRLDA